MPFQKELAKKQGAREGCWWTPAALPGALLFGVVCTGLVSAGALILLAEQW